MIQRLNDGKWWDCDHYTSEVSFKHKPENYRIKPEPKLRPWKPEEVPVGAIAKNKNMGKPPCWIISGVASCGVYFGHPSKNEAASFKHCLETIEYSTDNGKTWKPCGVEE